MFCWRICKLRYASPPAASFDGEGSRRRGGRWSAPGLRVAYASCSLALAAIEYFVNLNPEDAPDNLVSIRCEIPDRVRIEQIDRGALPSNWQTMPYPTELQHIGERWFTEAKSVCLLVPSAVVAGEQNVLIHSGHPDFQHLQFSNPLEFRFDARMWK
jgi:RES domain-containing protein